MLTEAVEVAEMSSGGVVEAVEPEITPAGVVEAWDCRLVSLPVLVAVVVETGENAAD